MKLLVHFKESAKYTGSISNLQELISFAQTQFHIVKDTVHLYYVDEQGDNITIAQNDDLDIMQSVNQGQDIIKVFLEGTVQITIQHNKSQQKATLPQEPVEQLEKNSQVREAVEAKLEETQKIEQLNTQPQLTGQKKEELKDEHEQRHGHWKRRKWEKIQKYMNETVAHLVDQRIKALIPCIRQQLAHPQEILNESITHQGYQCKSCLIRPIVGIRYQCPSCPQFNLCSNCQQKIDHQHHLLKIKKIIQKNQQEQKQRFKDLFKDIFKRRHHHGHHGHHGRSSSSNNQRSCPKRHYWEKVKYSGMSFMFGGQPEQYQAFIQENSTLRPRQLFQKYAKQQNISSEEYRKIFIAWRCNKLSHRFGKPAESYQTFVEQNYDARFPQLVDLLFQKGVQKRENCRQGWWGRKWHGCQKQQSSEHKKKSCRRDRKQKNSVQEDKKPKKKETTTKDQAPKKIEEKQEKDNVKQSISKQKSVHASKQPLLKKQSSSILRQKGELLIEMKEIFGMERSKEYYKFIEANFHLGKDRILQLWIDHLTS